MTANEVRQRFLDFYRSRGHQWVPSAPLVPPDDPTLLFTSAGMVPFKKYYAGSVELPFRRAVSVQKCLRVTDIEDVGRTPRHDTFFEMLGHFSFGDYFKREAIAWNWELFTEVYGLDPQRLTASVYEDDDEAYEVWRTEIGLPEARIVRLGAQDNFWGPAGETGACGPCSELYYDLGPELDPEHPDARPGDETDRFVEVGNFVFPQFDRQSDGRDLPLVNRGIDTGIGLERLAMVIQGKTSIFQTDLFQPLIEAAAALAGRPYAGHEVALHIVADHVRALTFALAEGILPASDGRGYVIRRLIRRAAVQGHSLGLREPFLHRLVAPVVAMMEESYPEVREGQARTELALHNEEERFRATLDQGLAKLEGLLDQVLASDARQVPGEEAFVLYDTYGLPLELVSDMALGRGLQVDEAGFQHCMAAQVNRSRSATSFHQRLEDLRWETLREGAHSEFRGYDEDSTAARVVRWAPVPGEDGRVLVVLDRTPFYGESGGQVGDTGRLTSGETDLPVEDTLREEGELRHLVRADASDRERLADPTLAWEARIDLAHRAQIRRHHTATHLLQAALREVLGKHVAQAGSRVAPDRLRFDFTHYAGLTPKERERVEELANGWILDDLPLQVHYSTFEEARREGVTALFGEKYEADRVRRVRVPGVSEELCGGTHVAATGQIGLLLILEESAVAAGTRRIEAVCGLAAVHHVQALQQRLGLLRRTLGSSAEELPAKVEQLQSEVGQLRKELTRARRGAGVKEIDRLVDQAEKAGAARIVVGEVNVASTGALRELGDRLRAQLGCGAAVLCATSGTKATFLAVVTDDLIARGVLTADALVRDVAGITGGSGGGQKHMALGGARRREQVPDALAHARRWLKEHLGKA